MIFNFMNNKFKFWVGLNLFKMVVVGFRKNYWRRW